MQIDVNALNKAAGLPMYSIEERAGLIVWQVLSEISPSWVNVLRSLPSGHKLNHADELFTIARNNLIRQEEDKGYFAEEAERRAARRLLKSNVY